MRDGYNCAKINFIFDEQVTDSTEIGKLTVRVWLGPSDHTLSPLEQDVDLEIYCCDQVYIECYIPLLEGLRS